MAERAPLLVHVELIIVHFVIKAILLQDFQQTCIQLAPINAWGYTLHPESIGGYIGMFQSSNSATIMSLNNYYK